MAGVTSRLPISARARPAPPPGGPPPPPPPPPDIGPLPVRSSRSAPPADKKRNVAATMRTVRQSCVRNPGSACTVTSGFSGLPSGPPTPAAAAEPSPPAAAAVCAAGPYCGAAAQLGGGGGGGAAAACAMPADVAVAACLYAVFPVAAMAPLLSVAASALSSSRSSLTSALTYSAVACGVASTAPLSKSSIAPSASPLRFKARRRVSPPPRADASPEDPGA
mmetsp:Transcript_13870/g.36848  ORF Transcript_13870/g.36848 Transcript_13870/m.36848 type:complete len:221 (-) Transcript_13870:170-832(-)